MEATAAATSTAMVAASSAIPRRISFTKKVRFNRAKATNDAISAPRPIFALLSLSLPLIPSLLLSLLA